MKLVKTKEEGAGGDTEGEGDVRLVSSWMHCLGGALGGAVHATVVCPALIIPRDLPATALKESAALIGAGSKPMGA